MERNRRILPDLIREAEDVEGTRTSPVPIQETCPPHYPQHHYYWENGTLGARCARCNTDYTMEEGKDYTVMRRGSGNI